MGEPYTILNVMGPYREPREAALSFDYSVQRPQWATPQGIRVKIALEEELDVFKRDILQLSGGTAGQQLRINQLLARSIGDQKLAMANEEHLFDERRDFMLDPFTGSLAHLLPQLVSWMHQAREQWRQAIKDQVGL